MEIRLLREFLVLSEQLNFSRAAERLNMTQPVLSRHIKFLEEYFEVQLLTRNTHKVELTSAGKVFVEEARKILLQYETSLSIIRSSSGKGNRSLSVAFLGEATRPFLSSFLAWFGEQHNDIAIECCDRELDEVVSTLEKGGCDLAFIIRPNGGRDIGSLRRTKIFNDQLCVVVNKKHPLAGQKSVSIRDVSEWPIIGVSRQVSPLAWECNTSFLTRYGLSFKVAKEYPNLRTCCFHLEFDERAIVLMPQHRRYLVEPNCVMIPVAEKDCWFSVELAWNANNANPSIDVFLRAFEAFSAKWSWEEKISEQPDLPVEPFEVSPLLGSAEPMSVTPWADGGPVHPLRSRAG